MGGISGSFVGRAARELAQIKLPAATGPAEHHQAYPVRHGTPAPVACPSYTAQLTRALFVERAAGLVLHFLFALTGASFALVASRCRSPAAVGFIALRVVLNGLVMPTSAACVRRAGLDEKRSGKGARPACARADDGPGGFPGLCRWRLPRNGAEFSARPATVVIRHPLSSTLLTLQGVAV